MKFSIYTIAIAIGLITTATTCSENEETVENDVELATAYGKELYLSEVKHLFKSDLSEKDSIELLKEYIHQWIQQQAVIDAINDDASISLYAVEKKVERIKNQLIILEYQKLLLNRELDTTVTEKDLLDYYESHHPLFKLERDLIRGFYIQIPKKWSLYQEMNSLIKKSDSLSIATLKEKCNEEARSYFFTDSMWINIDKLIANTPYKDIDKHNFMTSLKSAVKNDPDNYYLLHIDDFKLKGDLAPFSYYRDEIKARIIGERKTKLLTNVEEKLYKKALKSEDVEIYVQ